MRHGSFLPKRDSQMDLGARFLFIRAIWSSLNCFTRPWRKSESISKSIQDEWDIENPDHEITTINGVVMSPDQMWRCCWNPQKNHLPIIGERLPDEIVAVLWDIYRVQTDVAESIEIWKKMAIRTLEVLPFLPLPTQFTYNAWQPWVVNYGGENVAWRPQFMKYVAINAGRKKELSGRDPNDS